MDKEGFGFELRCCWCRMRLAWFYGMMILMMVEAGCESPAFVVKVNREMAPGTGFLQRETDVGGERRKFMVFVPAGYTAEKKWPAILFMHGLGGAGDDGAQQVATGL